MPQFWMCLMQYMAQGHCTNYWAVIETEMYSEYCQTFCKNNDAWVQVRNRGVVELGHFDAHFVKNTRKKRLGMETF